MPQSSRPLAVLIVTDVDADEASAAHALSQGLADAGHFVLGVRTGDLTLPEAVAHLRPDVIVVSADSGARDVLEHIVMATRDAPRPIAMFTGDRDRDTLRTALSAGVSAYVVDGLAAGREQNLRAELTVTKAELADRKLIDRAKRLLMKKKGMSEDEAHKFIQTAAMQKGLKAREVAERLIDFESLLG
jgi:two-component system, response regulator / RNA-binding antiterminator